MNPVIWMYVGVFSTALAAILLFLLVWRRRELRRTTAGMLANKCAEWGLTQLARLFTAYSIGNYFGTDSVTRVLHEIIDELQEGGFEKMLKKVGWKVVEGVFLKDGDDRKKLRALLTSAETLSASEAVPPPITSSS